jgi:nitric-oxide synthase
MLLPLPFGAAAAASGAGHGCQQPHRADVLGSPSITDILLLLLLLLPPQVRDMVGSNPIVLVGTKMDLLPAGSRPKDVADWLTESAARRRLQVRSAHQQRAAQLCNDSEG